jgi:hypothetical protein
LESATLANTFRTAFASRLETIAASADGVIGYRVPPIS